MSEYSKGPVVPTWYLAFEIECVDGPASADSTKVTVWENILLVEAVDLERAYDRAMDLGGSLGEGLPLGGGMSLTEIRKFVDFTPEEEHLHERLLGLTVRFVGLSKLVRLPSPPRHCLILEWNEIEPDQSEVSLNDAVPSVSELVATVERSARGVEWFAVEVLFSAAETESPSQPVRFAEAIVLVSAPTPLVALTKANVCYESAARGWLPESEAVSWRLKGPVWIGTATDGVEHGSELLCRERKVERDEVPSLVRTKQQLLTSARSSAGYSLPSP